MTNRDNLSQQKIIRLLIPIWTATFAILIIAMLPASVWETPIANGANQTGSGSILTAQAVCNKPLVYLESQHETVSGGKSPSIEWKNSDVLQEDEPVTESEPEKERTYSDYDLFCLAVAVCREAGGEPEHIQLLVANVVINRVNSPHYPDTIHEVLTQYRQYGMMWKNGIHFPDWAREKDIEQCYSVARRILDGERVCPPDVLYQAEFVQGKIYKKYDGFYFCYYGDPSKGD